MPKLPKLFTLPSVGLRVMALVLATLLGLLEGYCPGVTPQIAAQTAELSRTPAAHQAAHALAIPLYGPDGKPLHGPNNELFSSNWSGNIVFGSSLSAQATWTVPAVSYAQYSGSPSIEKSSSWIGIGGWTADNTLI